MIFNNGTNVVLYIISELELYRKFLLQDICICVE